MLALLTLLFALLLGSTHPFLTQALSRLSKSV